MSFHLTTAQFLDGSKDVTRRLGWANLSEEEVVAFLVMRQLEEMMGSDKIEALKKYRAIKGWQE